MEIERKPPWMMTLKQAEAIERAALRHDMSVEQFVVEVLSRLGTPMETINTKLMLIPQLEWLLSGKPPEGAPYYVQYMEFYRYPFVVYSVRGPQIDMTFEEFVKLCEKFHLVQTED